MNLKNIAIIMDGNGRWAKKNNLKIKEGHAKGVSALKEIVKECVNQKIESLTVYAFSTENWKRPKSEVESINNLIVNSCLLYTSPSPRDRVRSRMPSSA